MTDNAVALIAEEPSPIPVSAAAATISATDRAESRPAFSHDFGGFRRFLEFVRAYSADEEPRL